MSLSQLKIVNTLLGIAGTSTVRFKHAAAICAGKKILYSSTNNHRSKFGNKIYCCGHSEAVCIHNYMNSYFRGRSNKSLVLASLSEKTKS